MNVYAIRDRLLEYFLDPFIASNDKAVMHGLSNIINKGDTHDHALSQAPHHFELWRLSEIDQETGTCKGPPTFLTDCSSLVRRDIRAQREQGAAGDQKPPGQSPDPTSSAQRLQGAHNQPAEGQKGSANLQASESHPKPAGIHRLAD